MDLKNLKELRKATYVVFAAFVIVNFIILVTGRIVGVSGNPGVIRVVFGILRGMRYFVDLALLGTLIFNIVQLGKDSQNNKEKRFVIIALILFIISIVVKFGFSTLITMFLKSGMEFPVQGVNRHVVVSLLSGISRFLSTVLFLVSAALYVVGGVYYSKEKIAQGAK